MSKWQKKLNLVKFKDRVPCPYCPETFPSNVTLCRHVLSKHNWNADFLKGFEVLETHGAVMIVKEQKQNCPECDEPMKTEDHPVFGSFNVCEDCGLGIGVSQ